MIKFKKLIK